MSIDNFYNKTVSTQRLSPVAGTNKEIWATNLSTLSCSIRPQSGNTTDFGDGAFYKSFKMYCPEDTDILIGDRVIEGSTTYVVGAVVDNATGSGSVQHKAVMLSLGQ
jgi:hypothetical protein